MRAGQQHPPKGRILVVEDEEPVARLLELWLSGEGYQVRRAADFDQVCQKMGQEPFDLVTLDIMMPVVNGIQALKWLREYHPDVGVVMATALGDLDMVIEAMRLGAYGYMIKPFKAELVAHEVARAMERQRLVAENRSYQLELEQKVEAQTRELRAAHARLERQVRELEGRDRLVHCQMSGPTYGQACAEILEVLREALAMEAAVLYRPEAGGEWLAPVAALERSGRVVGEEQAGGMPKVGARDLALVAQVFRERQPKHRQVEGTALPLLYQEQVMGVLWARGLEGEDQEEQRHALWRLGREAALVLWAALVREELDSGAVKVDELLGLQ